MGRARDVLLRVAVVGAAACTDLPPVAIGVCGNHAVEFDAGEDCDTFSEAGTHCATPREPHACRYVCGQLPAGEVAECPVGLACGNDGVCRSGSGAFTAVATVEAQPTELLGGDLDGDGRGDVLAVGDRQIIAHYFDGNATSTGTLTIRVPARSSVTPVVGQLTLDQRDDIILAADFGLIAALGNAERRFEPTAHASVTVGAEVEDVRGIYGEVLPSEPGEELVAVGQVSGVSGIAFIPISLGTSIGLTPLPRPSSELAGAPLMANLDEDPVASPCDEVILAFADDPVVHYMSPCSPDGFGGIGLAINGPLLSVRLPDDLRAADGPTVLDVDRDGHLDIVLPARDGARNHVVVAYGRGTLELGSQPPLAQAAPDGRASILLESLPEVPLAIAHLDGDSTLDYVLSTGVWVSAGGVTHRRATAAPRGALTDAIVGDLNADGFADVLAATDGSVLEFHGSTAPGRFATSEVTIPGAGHDLAVGDFDGDRIADGVVAVRLASPPGETPRDRIGVLWGRPNGPPDPPQFIGDLTRVVQTAATVGNSDGLVDGPEDLATISLEASGNFSFAGFAGRADRQLRSAFVLVDRDAAVVLVQGYFATRNVLGDFTGDGHLDLGTVARSGDPLLGDRLWLTPVRGNSVFATDEAVPSTSLDASLDVRGQAVAVDLDADGVDEMVLFSPSSDDSRPGAATVARVRSEADGGWRWGLDTAVELEWTFHRTSGQVEPTRPQGGLATAVDLDGDGRRDVVIPAFAFPREAEGRPQLLVFWNDGDGVLPAPEVVPVPEGELAAFAVLGQTPERTTRLGLLSDGAVWSATVGASRRFELAEAPVVQAPGARLLASVDIDGDGVRDLASSDGSTLTLFRAVPRIP